VLVQAVIAGALSFAHLHDLAEAAGQSGWKAWAYPVSVDLLLVAAWRRLRTARRDSAAWTWFVIALFASLGANVATAGLLDLGDVPAWLRILVAGWPALAFLGGTLLVHTPAEPTSPTPAPPVDDSPAAPEVETHRADEPAPAPTAAPVPELAPAASKPAPAAAPVVPAALLDHARKIADAHRASTGTPMPADALSARLGLPAPMTDAIAAQLQLT
jgi:outer membrane biosynthesis protein TonB